MNARQANHCRGFSLLELLIVVAIILIISTIAIPSLIQTRITANEKAAIANLRTINTAEVTYQSSAGGYFATLPQLIGAGLLDSRFTPGQTVSGYAYNVVASGLDYTAVADPVASTTGRYGFYTTPEGVIRYTTNTAMAPAGQSGNPVQ